VPGRTSRFLPTRNDGRSGKQLSLIRLILPGRRKSLPHQCLNCGHVIEKGSDEILKGCSQCGGKKFIFTSTPLSEDRRITLKKKAEEVRDSMLKKADPELLKILQEKGVTELDGSSMEIESALGEEWVRVSPGGGEGVEIEEGSPETSLELVEGGEKRRSARDLISEYDRKKNEALTAAATKEKGKEAVRKVKGAPKKKGPGKRRTAARRAVKKGPDRAGEVDVINIVEQGVYEIDVEKLLEDQPIIIQKDGSYLLHLPSLFREGRAKKK